MAATFTAIAHNSSRFARRENLRDRRTERCPPPLFVAPDTRWRRIAAALARVVDIQAGSLWNDVAAGLATASGHVLDVGCGVQPYRNLLPREVTRYQGIDTTEAKSKFRYDSPDTLYFDGDVWPIADDSVDFVMATEVLEHVLNVSGFLEEAHRCLRPGGRLLLTVPFSYRWHFIPHDYWRLTPSCLEDFLVKAGFDEVGIYARGNALTVVAHKTMVMVLGLLKSSGRPAWRTVATRLVGFLLSPSILLMAAVGHLSLHAAGGDDCLGYTVFASKPKPHSGDGRTDAQDVPSRRLEGNLQTEARR